MSQQAIGLIETRGLVSLIEGTDAMLKAATDAGAEAIKAINGELISVHVIARPHSDVGTILPKAAKK